MNKYKDFYINTVYGKLIEKYFFVRGFFEAMAISEPNLECTVKEYFESLDVVDMEQKGINLCNIEVEFVAYIENMQERLKSQNESVKSITIVGGKNKTGENENISIRLVPGDVVSVVGPTGSGKSCLLADIEWLAQGDTPTERKILINDKVPPREWRFSIEHKLVAQLSQNMNFVMDLTVGEFIKMHCESRFINGIEEKIRIIIDSANTLCGEKIFVDTPVTALSGGQSRALMIADTGLLSKSPIVLIDEIENAGINKSIAVEFLIKNEKIVLIATHDPVLALRAEKRLVIKNGGIYKIINTTNGEREKLKELEMLHERLNNYRERLRRGEIL